jgi:archaeosine-15-forming tRNA-guanine transglycosylase
MPTTAPLDMEIAQRIEALLTKRSSNASICPSEVARSLASDEAAWRALMPMVRRVADELAAQGRLVVTQRGQGVSALTAKGAIRLAKNAKPPKTNT